MWFDIYRTTSDYPQKYWWVARGGNGETFCHSEMLSSKAACIKSIRTIKNDAAAGMVYDETGEVVGDNDRKRIQV
jgi:uncharacterized protein YegP (UPF0339 family)